MSAIEYRWVEGHPERYAEIAAEFVRLKVDVIFALGPRRRLRPSRQPPTSRSSFRSRGTRSPPALSQACRDRAAT